MDADLIVQPMLTKQLLNQEEYQNLMNANSRYQKNCLLLEKIRLFDMTTLELFCKLLQLFDSQKHIADILENGKSTLSVASVHNIVTFSISSF